MLRPQAFILLSVDEVLNFTGTPAIIIQLEVLDQPLDDPQLVVRIDDLEILRQPGVLPVAAQQAMGEAVKGANPEMVDGHVEQGLDAAAHLGCGLVCECDGQEALR